MKKNNKIDNSIDTFHKNKVKVFKQRNSNLNALQKELKIINNKLEQLENDSIDEDYLSNKTELITKKEDIEKNINRLENREDESKYYENIHNILEVYYNNSNNNNNNNNNNDININIEDDDENLLNNKINKNIINNNDCFEETIINSKTTDNNNNTFFIKKNDNNINNNNKAKLLNSYMSIVNKSYSNIIQKANICKTCNTEYILIQNEGISVCQTCGSIEKLLIDSEKPNYKDPINENSYFCYKRINHFNEWLSQFQAKESTEIPEHIYCKIVDEIRKMRIYNLNQLTSDKMRQILKKLKFNKYYEHIPHLINKLSGLPPPIMSREVENKLRIMFKEIQEPFIETCPKDRKNFLSYSYVLHKMCQLLGLDEFLTCFPLLKSREKLHNQDIMWRKITEKLNWEFIPSI